MRISVRIDAARFFRKDLHHVRAFCACLMAALLAGALARPAEGQSIRYSQVAAAGVPLKVITVNLNDPSVKITAQMTKFGAGFAEPFGQMVRRTRPAVALTGTFFCTRTKVPIGDIVIDGQLAHFGGLGTALCITDNNEVEFVRPPKYTHYDWSKFDFVMRCGPRLIAGGKLCVYPKAEGFKDRHMLSPNSRLAVGLTRHNKLVFVTTRKPVVLSRLAKAMLKLGVVDAINLDAGSSLGVHYKGKTIIKPGRWLTNLILVYSDRNRYMDRRDGLTPAKHAAARQTATSRAH